MISPGRAGRRWAFLLALLAIVWLAATPATADAHALLLRSTPAAGTVGSAAELPRQVSLWFSEPVDVAFNGISVLDAEGRRVDGLDAHVSLDDPRRVDVGVAELSQGAYLVRWRATSLDNHLVGGTFWFGVGFATTVPPAALISIGAPALAPSEALARWTALASLLVIAGAPLFQLLVRRPTQARLSAAERAVLADAAGPLSRLWLVSIGVFLLAHLLWAAAQAESVAELPLARALDSTVVRAVLLDSRFALLWWSRIVLGVVLTALLVRAARRPNGLQDSIATALGLALILLVSLSGHAAGARWLAPLAVGMDVLHLAAAAVWLGGLAQLGVLLLAVLRSTPELRGGLLRVLVPRVSAIAVWSVVVLAATGVFAAWEQSGTLEAVASTAYGQTLLIKIGLLVPLLALGAVNLFVVRPRVARGIQIPRLFSAVVRGELFLGAAILLVTATLTTLPPPGPQGLPEPFELARQAGDLRIRLTVDPNWVGVSHFEVALFDAQGQPVPDISDVILTFTMEGMNMGRTTVRATPRAPGVFEADGFYVGMPGVSQIGVAVSRMAGAEQSGVFRVETPNVSQDQFQGVRSTLGLGMETHAPALDAGGLTRGASAYAAHCVVCHGETGIGNGPAAPSLLPPPADLTLHARWHPDQQLFWFITHGVAGTAMPSFAEQLDPMQRWEIIGHLHALAAAPTASAPRQAPTGPALAAAPTPPAAQSALAGRLVFGPDSDKDFWVWRLGDDAPVRLTQFSRLDFASFPAWSSDIHQLAFSFYSLPRVGAIPAGTDLYVMDSDGSNMRMLAQHDAQGAALLYPAWAPDDGALYVTRQARASGGGTATSIDRIDAGSGARTSLIANAAYPSPSRDGRFVAFVATPNPDGSRQSLWIAGADGSDAHQLIAPGTFIRYSSVRFAPTGQHVLFAAVGQGTPNPLGLLDRLLGVGVARANGEEWDLWTIQPDGRDLRRLTNIAEDLPVASWSPTGDRIAFLGGGSARTAETGLVIMPADGASFQRLTTRPGHRGVDWSPTP